MALKEVDYSHHVGTAAPQMVIGMTEPDLAGRGDRPFSVEVGGLEVRVNEDTANGNIALGTDGQRHMGTGKSNTSVGEISMVGDPVATITGDHNVAVGFEAMKSLLGDRERYERYRENTQTVFHDTFSIGAVVDRLESVYEGVISAQENPGNREEE